METQYRYHLGTGAVPLHNLTKINILHLLGSVCLFLDHVFWAEALTIAITFITFLSLNNGGPVGTHEHMGTVN